MTCESTTPTFGTAYYPDYYPESDWARDLDRMRNAGLRTIRILEFAWVWYQPTPDTWRWDGLDHFLDLAADRGLDVCLATPTATPPPWFFQRYPDARLVNAKGEPCRYSRHLTCWNHPAARAEAWRAIETLARRYGNHPAVTAWQIDNEPNYAERTDEFYDFNPHFLADGRDWLRKKYGTLDALNAAWFAQFWSQSANDWDQVWETHHPRNNPHSHLDFLRWRDTNMADFVQAQAALLRKCTSGQKIGCNIPEVGIRAANAIGQDYRAQSRGLDWVGTDLYEATGDLARDLASFRLNCDLMRSCAETAKPGGAEFILAEVQGGPHERFWKSGFAAHYWDEKYLVASTEVFAERGADAVWYFCWRPTPGGVEIGMNGVQDIDGADTTRTEAVRRFAADPSPLAAKRAAYGQRPLALVHHSRDAYRFASFFEDLKGIEESMRGVHRWLDTEGWRVTFLHDEDLRGELPPADLLVLAESPLLGVETQEHIIAWADGEPNRRLLCGPNTALADDNGQLLARANRRLHAWLGVDFGGWHDTGVEGFRVLRPGPDHTASEPFTHEGREHPTRVTCPGCSTVHAKRWSR